MSDDPQKRPAASIESSAATPLAPGAPAAAPSALPEGELARLTDDFPNARQDARIAREFHARYVLGRVSVKARAVRSQES